MPKIDRCVLRVFVLTLFSLGLGCLNIVINARCWPGEFKPLSEYQDLGEALKPRNQGGDSLWPMVIVYDQLRFEPGMRIYTQFLIRQGLKFQYPPSALLVCSVFARLWPEPLARVHAKFLEIENPDSSIWGMYYSKMRDNWFRTFNKIGRVAWLWLALCSALITRESLRRYCPQWLQSLQIHERALLFGCVLALALSFYPALKAYQQGQIQSWLNALTATALFCWLRGWRGAAGVLLGATCLFKPQNGALLAWSALRREWRFTLAFCGVLLAGGLTSLAAFGWATHLDYLAALSYMARHGEGYYPNQSLNGLLNRLLHNGNNLNWVFHEFAPYRPGVYWATTVGSLLLLGLGFFGGWDWRRKSSPPAQLALMLLCATMASPIAWQHHYGILAPLFAWLIPLACANRLYGKYTLPLLLASYVLCANFFAVSNLLAETRFNFLQSYLFFGALGALALIGAAALRIEDGDVRFELPDETAGAQK